MKRSALSLAFSLVLLLGLAGALTASAEGSGGTHYSNQKVADVETVGYTFDADSNKYVTDAESKTEITLTPDDVMYLSSEEELNWFAKYINAGGPSRVDERPLSWQLHGDVNATLLVPVIGTKTHPFSGVFNGKGHTLTLSAVSSIDGGTVKGLFGYLKDAEMNGLSLTVTTLSISRSDVGTIAARAENSVITGCTVRVTSVNLSAGDKATYVGGVVGYAVGSEILDCTSEGSIAANGTSNGSISASGTVGGIVGYAENSTVARCTFDGSLGSSDEMAGGIVGESRDSSITDCGNTGDISGATCAAGVVGAFYVTAADKKITGCYNTGNIQGNHSAGGIVGRMDLAAAVTISESFNSGRISALTTGKGRAATDTLNGNGGIVGCVSGAATIRYCYNTGEIMDNKQEKTHTGGISGWGGDLDGCYSAAPRTDTNGDPLAPTESASFRDCYYDYWLFTIPPDPKWPTGIPGGRFISGEPLSEDPTSCFVSNSRIWNFEANKYPQLNSMKDLDAAQDAVEPRPGGYVDIGALVYDGAPISAGKAEESDVRYWLFGGYELGTATFMKSNLTTPTDAADGVLTEGGGPTAAGTYYYVVTFTCTDKDEITLNAKFTIAQRALAESDFNAEKLKGAETHTGSAITKTVTCAGGLSLAAERDYTVSHANNVDFTEGDVKASVTVTATGANCTGQVTYVFDICLAEVGAGRVVPLTSGPYRLGADGTWTCGDDPTVYRGGVPVYLEQGRPYDFTKKP